MGQRILKVLVVIAAALAMFSILGFDMTTAIAGLGIGSIALAFAALARTNAAAGDGGEARRCFAESLAVLERIGTDCVAVRVREELRSIECEPPGRGEAFPSARCAPRES